jgi:hypothetical protein
MWIAHERAQEKLDTSAMKSAKSLLEDVLKAYNDKSLDLAGARSLAAISGQFLDNVRQSSKTSAADLLWGESLNDEADLYAILGNNVQSLTVAKQAKDVAQSLMQSNSGVQDGMQLLRCVDPRRQCFAPGHRQEAMQGTTPSDRHDNRLIERRQGGQRRHRRAFENWRRAKDGDAKQHGRLWRNINPASRPRGARWAPDDFDL